ncbi:hypothetical protein [Achromobacter sp. NFACC18-2]|uniref:hypothetical protein n=1 Tax=Achromobacter sp. NFACC18-2 TaxID=1564112 RepID=UPI0008D5A3C9|nr:hypothetical protein [Achromobacter sp. NFACC18-2]SEJ85497.1 hypothetical protein SAMN03159494_03603 [Achromobacter sp. NFACC18-2]
MTRRTAGQRLDESRLEAALSNLARRIEAGEEFPDACWLESTRSNVPYEALQNAYDRACEAGTLH